MTPDELAAIRDDDNPPSLHDCVLACWDSPAFMAQYRRLSGSTLGLNVARSTIERMVDAATGHDPASLDEKEAVTFIAFVQRVVWAPLQPTDSASRNDRNRD